MSWYAPLRDAVSRGSQVDPVGGLAGLAAARELHLGQFFTPESVVEFAWRVVGLTDAKVLNRDGAPTQPDFSRPLHLLDNSFGSGRMFAPADPRLHALHGVEVDTPLALRVTETARDAGFAADLIAGSMLDVTIGSARGYNSSYYGRRDRFDVGLLNPPFSLHFDSPEVALYPGLGCFGKFGAASSCSSQHLAVAQALAWCDRVVAVVPRSFAVAELAKPPERYGSRLAAVFHLPRSVFRSEGAEVDVSVLVWRSTTETRPTHEITIDTWPIAADHPAYSYALAPITRDLYETRAPYLTHVSAPKNEPATDLPITGDRSVRLAHDGRHIRVACKDAATYVQAMNDLLIRRIAGHEQRRVQAATFEGQGQLDVETLLAQPDPHGALLRVVSNLRALGLQVSIDDSLRRYFARRVRQHAIDVTPFGHTAYVEDGGFADWLAAQSTVRVVPRADALTQRGYMYCEPGAVRECRTCDGTGLDPNYVHDPEDPKQAGACWSCHGAKVKDNAIEADPEREERLRILGSDDDVPESASIDNAITSERVGPNYKEPKSTKRWFLSMRVDGGRDVHGDPILRDVCESWLESDVTESFDFPDFVPYPEGWTVVHEGLASHFPSEFAAKRRRAAAEGVDRWLWDYQLHDLCEIALKRGAIIAWEMGLGKARLAAALCLLGGKHNLITVETRLIREMESEFKAIGLPASTWQTITKPEQVGRGRLRRINLISYDKLKSTLPGKQRVKVKPASAPTSDDADESTPAPKQRTRDLRHTYADALRRRIHTHVCDEGHLLANHTTQQSRAVVHVSAKGRRYLLTGTPISNYPRNVLRLMQWAAGDGTARQRFGDRWPMLHRENLTMLGSAPRGVDEFRERFVTLQWVTPEFADEMDEGAKREVPIIADIPGFRRVVEHIIKRRTAAEPEVAAFVKIPVPTVVDTIVSWDADHLALYQATSREFVDWYKREYQETTGKQGAHLIAVLRKLYAVHCAANYPQGGVSGQPAWSGGDTSKQRLAVERVAGWVGEGHKAIVLTESPASVTHLAVRLREQGIDVVDFHGGISITKRVDALDKRFRGNGKAQVLCATKQVLQTGYNIAEASRVLFFDGTWTPKTEQQAAARVLRPQQRKDVTIERLILQGSIDAYQRQMVDQKANAMRSGLDYGAGAPPGTSFRHLDSIFAQFVADFEATQNT